MLPVLLEELKSASLPEKQQERKRKKNHEGNERQEREDSTPPPRSEPPELRAQTFKCQHSRASKSFVLSWGRQGKAQDTVS